MNFIEAIDVMKDGKICFREQNPDMLFRIKDRHFHFKEKGYDWCPENVLELQDFDATDWEVSSKKYAENASVGDILLDDEEDTLMIVIDDDGDYLTTIDENGCLKTIDLDCNCYGKVGFYALIDDVINLLKTSREELKK